jgi:hypothetical protein
LGKITLITTANCRKKCTAVDEITVDKIKLIPFSKQDVKAAHDALSTNLQADDLASWIKADGETLIIQHLSDEKIAASVKNGETTDEPQASDTGSDSEQNGSDSCDVVVPKLSEVLENINEVMTQLEKQTDSELLYLLHLVNIEQYVLKKCSHQFQQTMLHDCFCKEA